MNAPRDEEGWCRGRPLIAPLLVLMLAACSQPSAATTTTVAQLTTTVAEAPAVDRAGAEATMTLLGDLARGWNEDALRWVAAYSDPNVGYDEFLRVHQEVLTGQASLIASTDLQVGALPADLQSAASAIVEHYQQRLGALDSWGRAIIAGDISAEEAAFAEYNAISNIDVLVPLMEALLTTPTLGAVMEADGVTPDQMIQAILGVLPDR